MMIPYRQRKSTHGNKFATNFNGISIRSGAVRTNRTIVHNLPANRQRIRRDASERSTHAVARFAPEMPHGGLWRVRQQNTTTTATPRRIGSAGFRFVIARMRTSSSSFFSSVGNADVPKM
jgi:hypothetical protein